MKRVNIHFSNEQLEALDKVLSKINKARYWGNVSRADVIRYALEYTYKIHSPNIHYGQGDICSFVDSLHHGKK